jgi:DeoR family transcriptional regulator, fructose operon transcriptional repressor
VNRLENFAAERRAEHISAQLEAEDRVRVADLAKQLDVSEMTIRRDLQNLEAAGVVRRVRGGAVSVGNGPVPFRERERRAAPAKARIAVKLMRLVGSTGAIGIDASSTNVRLAAAIRGARDLTVVTNSLETFAVLQGKLGVTPFLTGGQLDPRTGSLVGPLACRAAGDLLLNRLFVSAAGVDSELGSSEACLEEAEVKRSFGGVAGEIVLAVDSSKLGTRALAPAFRWEQLSLLVTELDPADKQLDPYRSVVEIV